jgi:competence protein ComEA
MKRLFNFRSLLENNQKYLKAAIIGLLILAALFMFFFRTGDKQDQIPIAKSDSAVEDGIASDTSTETIIVDVSGEVETPSVIELPLDSRINDAIQAAGGLTKNADISQINRAAMLSDGEKVFIPTKPSLDIQGSGSGLDTSQNTTGNQNTTTTKVNINNASSEQLQEVPGIGPVTANKIILFRTQNGLFRKLEDIKKVSGIGDKTFEKMKPYICI